MALRGYLCIYIFMYGRYAQLTHNICRMFSDGSHKVSAVPTFWEHSGKVYHKVSVIFMFNIVPHKS